MYERAVVGALGASGVTYAAYKLLFPWIGQDIHDIRLLSPLKARWEKYVENQKRLVDAFEEKGLQTPDKYFIIYNDTVYTYGQMLEAANRVSHVARTWGLEQGEAAALFMENEPAYIAVFFGLQMVGIPVALLNHNIRGESLERCIKSVDTKIVISGEDEHLVEALLEIQPNLPGTQLFVHGRSGTELPPCMNSLTDLLKVSPTSSLGKEARAHSPYDGASFYIYTSGTTGLPKAAKSTHARACGALNLLPAIAQITADDIVYTTVPLFHSSGFIVGLAGIIAEGATVVLRKKFSASHFWEDCCRHRVTVVQYIGELIRYLLAQPVTAREKQHCVRVAVGNGLREDIWEEFQRRCRIPSIVEFFAASEGGSILVNLHNVPGACGRYSPFMQRMDPYPKYLIEHEPGTDQPRRNKNGRCVKVRNGQPGLLIAAFSPMSKPEDIYKADMSVIEKKLLRNVFKDGDVYFNYGDLLYLDKNYFFRFADRTGDTFRWKGENVSTQEVSNILSRVDFLLDANVYGVSIPGFVMLVIYTAALVAASVALGSCDSNLTVTAEAWFDVEIKDYDGPGDDFRGRFVIALFGRTVPMTVMNFASIAKGFERKKEHGRTEKLHYKNSHFHRVVPDFVIQGGDVTTGDGTGGKSIFGEKFVDENYVISHKAAGYVSMANHGRDTNGSQFFVILNKARWLDTKHVVFGKVIKGMDTIRAIGEVSTSSDARPKKKVKIIDCGVDELEGNKIYELSDDDAVSDGDIDRDN